MQNNVQLQDVILPLQHLFIHQLYSVAFSKDTRGVVEEKYFCGESCPA
jgi:hypothetical protein